MENIKKSSQQHRAKPSTPARRTRVQLEKQITEMTDEVLRLKKLLREKSSQVERLSIFNARFWRAKRYFEGLTNVFKTDDV